MTYSIWDSEEVLEQYRDSELFKSVWTFTKTLFSDKPTAFSAKKIEELP
jgi:heme-degrading monooxygenase HmoA